MKSIPPIHKVSGYMTGNIYIIEGDGLTLIDTGCPLDYKLVLKGIKSIGRSPRDVERILLTHFHVDHAGSAAILKEICDAELYIHEADAPFMEGTDYVPSIYRAGFLGRAASLFPKTAEKAVQIPSVKVDVPLKDGDVVPILGGLEVIHAPGHTPGNASYFWRDRGVLFCGDAIDNSYWFFTLPTVGFSCDFDQAAKSARKVVDAVEDEDIRLVCGGHGPFVGKRAKERLLKFRESLVNKDKA